MCLCKFIKLKSGIPASIVHSNVEAAQLAIEHHSSPNFFFQKKRKIRKKMYFKIKNIHFVRTLSAGTQVVSG